MAFPCELIDDSLLRLRGQHATPSRRSWGGGGQPVSSDTQAVRNSTKRLMMCRDVDSIVKSWRLKYSGGRTENIEVFLAMLESHRTRDGLSEEEMLLSVSEVLDGPALTWYHNNVDEWNNFAEFVADAKEWFYDDVKLQHEARDACRENDCLDEHQLDQLQQLMQQLVKMQQAEGKEGEKGATTPSRQGVQSRNYVASKRDGSREKKKEFSKPLRYSLDERPDFSLNRPAGSSENELRSGFMGSSPLPQ